MVAAAFLSKNLYCVAIAESSTQEYELVQLHYSNTEPETQESIYKKGTYAIMVNKKGRIDRKDVFHAGLVEHARFEGTWEMPVIPASDLLPDKLLPFDHALSQNRFDHFVHFYIDDERFERIWRRPGDYLARLSKFKGCISPDFSLYRDLPLGMQLWNTYRGRALGYWLSVNGMDVIPNVRWSDERSYPFCFDGIQPEKPVAVGTHGCIQHREDRQYFLQGLEAMVERLHPSAVIVYGQAPDELFQPCLEAGIPIHQFDSRILTVHQREVQ